MVQLQLLKLFFLAICSVAATAQSAEWPQHVATQGLHTAAYGDYEEAATLDLCLKTHSEETCNPLDVGPPYQTFFETDVGCCNTTSRNSLSTSIPMDPMVIGQFTFTETNILVRNITPDGSVQQEGTFTAIGILNEGAGACGHPFCEEMTFTITGFRLAIKDALVSVLPNRTTPPPSTEICSPLKRKQTGANVASFGATDDPSTATLMADSGVAPAATKYSKYPRTSKPAKHAQAPSHSTKNMYNTKEQPKYPTKEYPEEPSSGTKDKYGNKEYLEEPSYDTKSKYENDKYHKAPSYDSKSEYDTEEKPEEPAYDSKSQYGAQSKYGTKDEPEEPSYYRKSKYGTKDEPEGPSYYRKSKYGTKDEPEEPSYYRKSKYGTKDEPEEPSYYRKSKYGTKDEPEEPSYYRKSKYSTKDDPEEPSYDRTSKYGTNKYPKGKYGTKEYPEEHTYNRKSKYDDEAYPDTPSYHYKSKYEKEHEPDSYGHDKSGGYYPEEEQEDYHYHRHHRRNNTSSSNTTTTPSKAYRVESIVVYRGPMTIYSRLHKTEYTQGYFEFVRTVNAGNNEPPAVVPGKDDRVWVPYTNKLTFYKPSKQY